MINLNIIESYESINSLKLVNFETTNDIFLVYDSDSHNFIKKNFPNKKVYVAYKIIETCDLEKLFNKSLATSNQITNNLQSKITRDLEKALGVDGIGFLETIFTYKSTYAIFHDFTNTKIMNSCLSLENISRVNFFSGRSINNSFFNLEKFLNNYFLNKKIPINTFNNNYHSGFFRNLTKRIKLLSHTKIKRKISQVFKSIRAMLRDLNLFVGQSKKILVLSGFNFIDVFKKEKFRFIDINKINLANEEILDNKKMMSLNSILEKISIESDFITNTYFIEDLKKNILNYLRFFNFFRNKERIHDFDGIYWGLPLIFEPDKSLIVDLAMQRDIEVYGRQHGCSYCTQVDRLHFYSDFDRCSTYFSYGFGKKELKDTYPEYSPSFKIIKSPPNKDNFYKKSREIIDITFPIANSKTEFICEQETIINALIERDDLNIVIKSISSPDTFFRFNKLIEKYPHIRLINNLTFKDFLKNYYTKLFIFEVPSTTLDEAINEDSDIILRASRLFPFSSLAQKSLLKRAFIYEDNKELYNSVLKYNPLNIEKLRDNSYYNMYLSNEQIEIS